MDLLKQWMISLVFCAIIGAVVNILTPKGGTERVMKVVVATFLICAFLSPFITGDGLESDFELPEFSENKSDLSDSISESMLSQAEFQSVLETESLLESLEVDFISVEAAADVNEENQIYIKSITVTAYEKFSYREKQIESNLKTMFSAEVIFIWEKK
ncbi:MAG: stage III sporulation protein AF [Clostridia bacterium]|nr:hypothetical protein [Oscillospiraceae bacterium]MBQ2829023.1 stage III sporulation protein AF [Clostridia bacterium]